MLADEKLIKKYDKGFMYVEYPHKSQWREDFDDKDYRKALQELFVKRQNVPILLYVHIPFCRKQCYFCICHTSLYKKYDKIKEYLSFLYQEIDLLAQFLSEHSTSANIKEIHIGGGSPTLLKDEDFDKLIEKISEVADLKNISEISLEIDPRTVTIEKMHYYHTKGVNRISFGVQDFDPDVQKAINRQQPLELFDKLLAQETRQLFHSVNFDILCGLPKQTIHTFKTTIEQVIRLAPDRIDLAFFNYAPRFASHQLKINQSEIPDVLEKYSMFAEACQLLENNGYLRIGFDHFAKKTDTVASAMANQQLRWNSLGYAPGDCVEMLGVGLHSASRLTGKYYTQNYYEFEKYKEQLLKNKFPTFRGYKLSSDDIIRREVINTLRNYYYVDFKKIEKSFGINYLKYFKQEIVLIDEFVEDSVIKREGDQLIITEPGKAFVNQVCRIFDIYNRSPEFPKHFFDKLHV